jgi:hypothetical protein
MIVALARKLVIAPWRFVTTGETLEGVILRPAGRTPGRAFPYLLGARLAFRPTAVLTIRGGGTPYSNMALMPTERMGPPPGALPPMRMTASWSRIQTVLPHTSLWHEDAPQWQAPLGSSTDRHRRRRSYAKSPCRSSSFLREPATNQKRLLDRKSHIQVRIHFPPTESLQTLGPLRDESSCGWK